MSELGLDGTTGVRVGIPVLPGIAMPPPQPPGVVVAPTAGPPGAEGQPGPPGQAGDVAGQLRLNKTAAQTLGGHRVVTTNSVGNLVYASNDVAEQMNAPMWLTENAISNGATDDIIIYGHVVEPSWSWTPGPLYLGTNGLITQTPPEAPFSLFLTQVGFATSPTSAFFERSPSISLNLE